MHHFTFRHIELQLTNLPSIAHLCVVSKNAYLTHQPFFLESTEEHSKSFTVGLYCHLQEDWTPVNKKLYARLG